MNPELKLSTIEAHRLIGQLKGTKKGPTLIFFAGIHGNEPAGIEALKTIFDELKGNQNQLSGECFGLAGNLKALNAEVRFLDEDLNRIWFPHQLGSLLSNNSQASSEKQEMAELFTLIQTIILKGRPPFYFIDLHTTSGETSPFIVMNDSLLNRRFTKHYPLPVILGIEEYLSGALLSYINELGYVSIGFESGQHHAKEAVINAKLFIKYTLALTGFISSDQFELLSRKTELQKANNTKQQFFEIYYQHLIQEDVIFKMLPGFENFQAVPKGVAIALNGDGIITTNKKRQLFMPLYQDKGYEGFYFIRSIPRFFLLASKFCRLLGLDKGLAYLPGISWTSHSKESLMVNKNVARFFAKSLFHLLGYRTREIDRDHFILKSREQNSKKTDYRLSSWY